MTLFNLTIKIQSDCSAIFIPGTWIQSFFVLSFVGSNKKQQSLKIYFFYLHCEADAASFNSIKKAS